MLDHSFFLQLMAVLFEMYDRQPTKVLLEGYYMVLQDMSNDEFSASVKSILQSRKFASLPKPAEILDYAKPDIESIATLAWGDVERAIYKAGKYASLTFEDPVVNSVIDALGGWVWLCSQDVSEMKWVRKEFPKLYGIHSKLETHPTHLIGLSERENGYTKEIAQVRAAYVIQTHKPVPALNPSPARSVNEMMIGLSNQVRVS